MKKRNAYLKKKGISPLIATVLLIGFTVALAALVMTWGSGFIKKITTETSETTDLALKCVNLGFRIKDIDCNSNEMLVTNEKSIPIKAIIFKFSRGTNIERYDYNKTVIADFDGETITLADIGASSFNVDKIEAIPVIAGVSGGEDKVCDNYIEEYPTPCS